ncbi:MAG: hypothetical protein SGCHY_004412, partial [Lobulomycetales sp.]
MSGAPSIFPGAALDPQTQALASFMESCPAKTVLSTVAGFGMGGLFGMFMSSVDYNPASTYTGMTTRQQMAFTLRDMGARSYSTARNFAVVGGLFAGTECVIETYRGKNDMWNGVSAGAIAGAVLAAKSGPQAMALGSAGFAAFSAAIDYYI